METTGETEEDAEVPASGAVKAKIQLWESGDTLSLHRKDVKNKTFRQSLYSDSSLRRPTTRDPRSVRLPLLHIDTGEDTTSVQPRDAGERTAGSSDFKGRRLRMASTGSMLEASDVLAAALEQMDGIIAGSRHDIQNITPSHNPSDWWQTPQNVGQVHSHSQSQGQLNVTATRVSRLLGDVKYSLEASEEKEEVKNMLSRDLVDYLKDWIMSEDYFLSASGYLPESVDEKLRKLEADKQSLALQVSVLSEQVEAQSEKMAELEFQVDDRDNRLMQAQDMLQSQQVGSGDSNQRVDTSANTCSQELLTHTSLETHKLDLMAEISSLKLRLASTEKDRRELDERCRIAQRQIAELEAKVLIKDAEMAEMRQRLIRNGTVIMPEPGGESGGDRTLDREKTLDRLKRKQTEVEKLKKAVDTLMMSNEDKDRRIDDMRRLLKRYRRVEEILVQAQGRKAVEELLQNVEDDTSSTSSSSLHDTSLRDHSSNEEYNNRHGLSSPSATSTPVHYPDSGRVNGNHGSAAANNLPISARQALGMTRSNSCENIAVSPDKGSSDGRKKGSNHNSSGSYAHTEVVTDDEDGLQHMGVAGTGPHDHKKRRGLRRLFGKLKRSSSQDFEGGRDRVDGGEFRRGGVRATATARLAGWSQRTRLMDTDVPFSRWDCDRVTAWLNEIGLNMYLGECKRWVRNGEQLLRASLHDLEKELNIKNVLHRKKLQLALQAMGGEKDLQICDLDHNFVARWLDDIGLPQYKDSFYDARVDGRMLHYLTVDDLMALKVVNELHHISIKRGIQILRLNGFNPGCLRRRPFPEELNTPIQNLPGEVMLWTNHRVMEWLRTIDLSEYAPNLRGSGVHGALMVLEPRFNAELFALLLSIPSNKTLLRRHLSTHFVGIIGPETQTRKREYESSPGYMPLMVNAKIKKGKFGLFGHKRTKSDCEADSFICPMEGMKNGSKGDSKAAQEIGAMSKEIHSLTTMLSQERFMDSTKTSNV